MISGDVLQIEKYFTFKKDVNGRYASQICQVLSAIDFPVYIQKDNRQVNAKSLIGVLSAGYKCGDVVKICVPSEGCNIDNVTLALSELI